MKRLLICIFAAVVLFGCGNGIPEKQADTLSAENESNEADSAEIFNACIDSGEFGEMVDFDSDYMLIYFGIDTRDLVNFAAGEALDAASSDALIILKAQDDKIDDVRERLELYFDRKVEELKNYNAEEYAKAEKCEVVVNGNYVYLVICENADTVEEIIEGMI